MDNKDITTTAVTTTIAAGTTDNSSNLKENTVTDIIDGSGDLSEIFHPAAQKQTKTSEDGEFHSGQQYDDTKNESNVLDSLAQKNSKATTTSSSGAAVTSNDSNNTNVVTQTATAEILIEGMSCAMCSNAIEAAIKSNVPNVTKVEISLTTDIAEVEWNVLPSSSTLATNSTTENSNIDETLLLIKSNIIDIGYDVSEIRLLKSRGGKGNRRKTSTVQTTTTSSSELSSDGHDSRSLIETNNDTNQSSNQHDSSNNINTNNYPIDQYDDDEEETVEERWQRYRDHQTRKLLQRRNAFFLSLVGTLPILCLTMILPCIMNMDNLFHNKHVTIFHKYHIPLESLLLWILATPVQFVCGYEFYKMAWYGFKSGRAGMDVLVALGTSASYGYALLGIFKTTADSENNNHSQHDTAHFFETSAVLICFVLAGKWMQAVAVRRTSDALSHLMTLQTKTAIKVIPLKDRQQFNPINNAYVEEIVPIEQIKVGDMVKIIRGASIPADGRVLFGEMLVNEAMVTGESLPVLKTPGSIVLGGTVCVETSTSCGTTETSTTNTVASTLTSDNNADNIIESSTILNEQLPIIDDVENGGITSISNLGIRQTIGAGFVEVTGVGSSTALAQIVRMVQQAQTRTVPIQSFADAVSAVFVPTVCAISVITYLVWYALCSTNTVPTSWYVDELNEDASTFSLMFAIACLVISCPCALGLATPTAVMVGTGVGASKCGVLMKGGQALEIASHVTTIILDKTGTITKGTPTVSDFIRIKNNTNVPIVKSPSPAIDTVTVPSMDHSEDLSESINGNLCDNYVLWLLASLERTSEHPLAKAVVSYVEQQMGEEELALHPFAQPTQFRAKTGKGCRGTIVTSQYNNSIFPLLNATTDVVVGNRSYAVSIGIDIPRDAHEYMKRMERQGKTSIFGAVDGHVCVVLGISDEVKPDAKASIYYLREKLKLDVWMVTGDNARTAVAVARQLDIPTNRVVSEALPADKLAIVKSLQADGQVVAMVGDGVNDSPALAQADVGMSLGTGASEIAAEASDMVLVKGDMASVCTALHLSRAIFRRIQWNFVWSLLYNILGIPVAAGVFYPFVHARLPPTVAALAMALSSVSVVISSLTLRFYRPPDVIQHGLIINDRRMLSTPTTRTRTTRRRQVSSSDINMGTDNDMTVRLLSSDQMSSDSTEGVDNRS
jgi:P-type Cu+ transporter